MRAIDLTGKRFGRLLVLSQSDKRNGRRISWLCQCDCGVEKDVVGESLRYGNTKSCGCLNHESKRIEKKCPVCGILFKALNRPERGTVQKYCSKECDYADHRKKHTCLICGSEFILKKSATINGVHKGMYCSKDCFHESQKGKRVSIKSEFKKGFRPSVATEFKKGENMGENHPNWKGGISSEYDKIKHTEKYKKWRNAVYRKDYWTCQECGKHCERKDIAAHHIKSFADYPELRFDLKNGITYCRGCHLALHNKLRNNLICALAS